MFSWDLTVRRREGRGELGSRWQGSENSKCKGPEVGACLARLGNGKVAAAGAGRRPKGRWGGRHLKDFCTNPSPQEARRPSLPGASQVDSVRGTGWEKTGGSAGRSQTPQSSAQPKREEIQTPKCWEAGGGFRSRGRAVQSLRIPGGQSRDSLLVAQARERQEPRRPGGCGVPWLCHTCTCSVG